MYYRTKSRKSLNRQGTTIAELPAGLWIIIVGFCLPLLGLVLTTIRFGLFWEAAREAADAASQTPYYLDPSGPGSPGGVTPNASSNGWGNSNAKPQTSYGAVAIAQSTAVKFASIFPGVSVNPDNVQCYIVTTPLTSGGSPTVLGPDTPLSSPADPSQNLYQIRVDVTGSLQPIINLGGIYRGIAGLNAALPVKVSMYRVYENPQGLNQYASH